MTTDSADSTQKRGSIGNVTSLTQKRQERALQPLRDALDTVAAEVLASSDPVGDLIRNDLHDDITRLAAAMPAVDDGSGEVFGERVDAVMIRFNELTDELIAEWQADDAAAQTAAATATTAEKETQR